MGRSKRNSLNKDTMNEWCNKNEIGYEVLETKWIDKGYQKQLWAYIKCPIGDHEPYWVWWNNFIRGYKCKKCHYESKNFTMWDNKKVVDFYNNYGLKVINVDAWKNVDGRIEVEDNIGFKYMESITNLKQMGKCSKYKFNKLNPFTIYNINLYCKLYRSDYELISDNYIDIKTLYTWKYKGDMLPNTENREFKLMADSFINGNSGHPYFSKSKGEIIFEELLKENNIKYKREKTFKGCKDKILLRFDFYLPKYNEAIEIDGLQHGQIVEIWGGTEGLEDRIRRDLIKDNYCKYNGIKLTRILYDHTQTDKYKQLIDNKIEQILSQSQSA